MDVSKLTDYQLFELIQSISLNADIKKLAIAEFDDRKLSIIDIQKLIAAHDAKFGIRSEKLTLKLILLLILFPFFLFLNSYISGSYLAKGQKKKWSGFWLWICIGYFFWLIIFILIGKYFLFK